MTSQITETTVYNVQYVIPRIVLGTRGRQNNALTGSMKITRGAAEPIEFIWGDTDGIPVGLLGFTAKLVFWSPDPFDDEQFLDGRKSEIIMSKPVEIKDPYKGIGFVMLTGEDTSRLGMAARSRGIRWGLYLINENKDVFPCTVSEGGNRWGILHVEWDQTPDMESIKSS